MIRAIGVGSLASALSFFAACSAAGEPQISAAATIGVAGNGDREGIWRSTGFSLGLRAEALLLRDGPRSFGLGPYLEALTTTGFSDAQLGAGVGALLPVHPLLPIVVSLGAYERRLASAWGTGLSGALFVGSRSYNYHGCYAMSAGLLLEARRGFADPHDTSLVAALDIDLELLGLPVLMLIEAVR